MRCSADAASRASPRASSRSRPTRISPTPASAPCLWAEEPAWSHDGTRIAYNQHTQTHAGEISAIEFLDVATGTTTTVY